MNLINMFSFSQTLKLIFEKQNTRVILLKKVRVKRLLNTSQSQMIKKIKSKFNF